MLSELGSVSLSAGGVATWLQSQTALRGENRNAGIALKITEVERQNMRESVTEHRGDESCIVRGLALCIVSNHEAFPMLKDRPLVAQ